MSDTTGQTANGGVIPAAKKVGKEKVFPPEPRTLLIADDEHLVVTGLTVSLQELGYIVVGPASDGEEAIELCSSQHPDMALLDIRMPKKDGLEAAEIVFKRHNIPVVIFSAFSDQEYIEAGNRAGIFGYMLKPVTQDQLRVGVSVAWGRFLDHVSQNTEIGDLKIRLENRKIIEQAKWIIVQRKGVSEPEAMKLLQRQARNNRRTLADVSRSLLENEELFQAE